MRVKVQPADDVRGGRRSTPRMISLGGTVVVAVLSVMLTIAGCDRRAGSSGPTTLEGAWRGEGQFTARAGQMAVKAQLELLDNGTYRFMIFEPALLALTGAETGQWTRDGESLTLAPGTPSDNATTDDGKTTPDSAFAALRRGSPVAAKPPKQLAIAAGLRDLRFDDGQLALTFTPNPEATAQLRAAGEVGTRE